MLMNGRNQCYIIGNYPLVKNKLIKIDDIYIIWRGIYHCYNGNYISIYKCMTLTCTCQIYNVLYHIFQIFQKNFHPQRKVRKSETELTSKHLPESSHFGFCWWEDAPLYIFLVNKWEYKLDLGGLRTADRRGRSQEDARSNSPVEFPILPSYPRIMEFSLFFHSSQVLSHAFSLWSTVSQTHGTVLRLMLFSCFKSFSYNSCSPMSSVCPGFPTFIISLV